MDNSALARLSPDLRNYTYELALQNLRSRPVEDNYENDFLTIPLEETKTHNGLTRTCCQIRAEARPMFWSTNDFSFAIWYPQPEFIARAIELLRSPRPVNFVHHSLLPPSGQG